MPPVHDKPKAFALQKQMSVLRSRSLATARMLCLCMAGAFSLPGAWAQTPPTPAVTPAPGATCVASAQNRTTPIDAQGDYVLYNLPGNGLIPFGVGGSAQPFRVRATCDDGTVGETEMAFPAFEQRVVNPGAIQWGKNTPVPTGLSLSFLSSTISEGQSLQALTLAKYADGQSKDVTARATGTGYRSSATLSAVVNESGEVWSRPYIQGLSNGSNSLVITAENDGVVTSRVLKLISQKTISGKVLLENGQAAGAGVLVQLKHFGGGKLGSTVTDANGGYVFAELPVGFQYFGTGFVSAYQTETRLYGRSSVDFKPPQPNLTANVQLKGIGAVRVKVLDAVGSPVAGIAARLQDEIQRNEAELVAAQVILTDGNGVAQFSAVPAGLVVPLVAASGGVATPTNGTLAANGTLEFEVRLAGGAPLSQASVAGIVTQDPDGSPAVGAIVKLVETTGVLRTFTQVLPANGQYRFDGLQANAGFQLQVWQGGAYPLTDRVITTGADGSVSTLTIRIPKALRLLGTVFQSDSVSAVPGANVQLSSFSSGTWWALGTAVTDANGLYQFSGLTNQRYRLDASTSNGQVASAEVDLSTASGRVVQNITLASAQATITQVTIKARMMGLVPGANLVAQVFVSNSKCASPCLLGELGQSSAQLVTDPLPSGLNHFEVVWKGRKQAFDVAATDIAGVQRQNIQRTVDFPADAMGELKVPNQRTWHTFSANSGDALQVLVAGLRTATSTPAYAVKMELYGPDQSLVTDGYGFSAETNYGNHGGLLNFAIPATGTYTLVTSAYYPNDVGLALGTYGLTADLNNAVLALDPWQAQGKRFGGSVSGRILRSDGTPAALEKVLITATTSGTGLVLREQAETLADGSYHYDNLPLGEVTVTVADSGAVLASGSATLSSLGQEQTVNLTMFAKTTLNVTVRVAADSPFSTSANFTVKDAFGERTNSVSFYGTSVSTTTTLIVAGDTITLKAVHPSNSQLFTERAIAGSDGQTQNIELALVAGRVTGRTLNAAGAVMPNVTVTAYRQVDAVSGTYLTSVITDSQGVFILPTLAVGQSIRLIAEDQAGVKSAAFDVSPIEGQTVTAPDMRLDSGSLQGRVLFGNSTPAAYIFVWATTYSGRYLYADADAQGVYRFAAAPAGQPLAIHAANPNNNVGASVSVVVVGSTTTNAPDLVFAATGQLTGRVVRLNGTGIAGASVVLTEAGDTACSGWDGVKVRLTATTDSEGYYVVDYAPARSGLSVSVNISSVSCVEVTQPAVPVVANGTAVQPDIVFTQGVGSFHVRMVDANGQSVEEALARALEGECGVSLTISGPDGFVYSTNGFQGDFYNLPLGSYSALVEGGCPLVTFNGGPVTINDGDDKLLPIIVPLIKGTVRQANGAPAQYGNVTAVIDHGDDGPPTVLFSYVAADGSYILADSRLAMGTYLVTATDGYSGYSKTVEVNVTSSPALVQQDITLPGIGSARVLLRTATGVNATNGYAQITNADMPGWNNTVYIYAGSYNIFQIPQGNNTIYFMGTDPSYGQNSYAMASAVLNTNGGSVDLGEVRLLPFGTVVVTTLDPTGAMPEASRQILVRSARLEPLFKEGFSNKVSDSTGKATFVVPAIPYNVSVSNSYVDSTGGTAPVLVSAGQTTTLSVARSGAVRLGYYMTPFVTDGGLNFRLSNEGTLFGSAGNAVYDTDLTVNGFRLPSADFGLLTNAGRELQAGPFQLGNSLQVKRRMFVPLVGGYARLLDSFTNMGTTPVSIAVANTASNRSNSKLSISASASGNKYIAFDWVGYMPGSNYLGLVYGDGVGLLKPIVAPFGQSDVLRWSLTIPAGQTMSLMTFHLIETTGNLNALQIKMDDIVNKTMLDMWKGMTPAESSNTMNFYID